MMNDENYAQGDKIPGQNFEYIWQDSLLECGFSNPGTTLFTNQADELKYHAHNPETQPQIRNPKPQPQFGCVSLNGAGTSSGYPLNVLTPELQLPMSTGVQEVPISSLPATKNWTGDYGFDVYFEKTDAATSGSSWTYSHRKDKLYVKKDAPCPIKFVTTEHVPFGASIRAMIVFIQAQFVSDVVKRCYNHTQKDLVKGAPLPTHVLRCESLQAVHEEDPITRRHSVTVAFENPQRGTTESTYVYSFACWGSCTGGINRRPIKIIFTLEHGDTVIGRRSMELRICACPARDRLSDERVFQVNVQKSEKIKRKQPIMNEEDGVAALADLLKVSPSKKARHSSHPTGMYNISVHDNGLYRFLKRMERFYKRYQAMTILAPQIKQLLNRSSAKSESSGEDKRTSEESE